MARLAEADQAALSRLVVAVHPDVYRRCHRLTRHEHTADDLAQEVWRKFVEHWEVLSRRDLDGQLAWLYTVCSNTFVDQVRRQRVWADLIPKVEVLFDHLLAVPDPEEQVLRKDVLDRAQRLMREMPPAQYLATWLCWGKDGRRGRWPMQWASPRAPSARTAAVPQHGCRAGSTRTCTWWTMWLRMRGEGHDEGTAGRHRH
ncbi:sigma-70 family RNA polymerase sigma factor [Streptacidiphilus sp. 4-A2]|nr:sigma-70 family RNA polymerase sigma factor [Streptacidiphilus sp. 4-A2]